MNFLVLYHEMHVRISAQSLPNLILLLILNYK